MLLFYQADPLGLWVLEWAGVGALERRWVEAMVMRSQLSPMGLLSLLRPGQVHPK